MESANNHEITRLIAIMLQYKKEDGVPKVIGRGNGFLAQKIIDEAKNHRIAMIKDVALADMLNVIENDEFIPFEAYSTVAKILHILGKAPK